MCPGRHRGLLAQLAATEHLLGDRFETAGFIGRIVSIDGDEHLPWAAAQLATILNVSGLNGALA